MDRRTFLTGGLAVGATLAAGTSSAPAARRTAARRDVEIDGIYLHRIQGRRATPVAPNAYARYRGYTHTRSLLRITTTQGLTGIAEITLDENEVRQRLGGLLGTDPTDLFRWSGDRISGPGENHASLVENLGGADAALLDLLGKAHGQPVADLLGPRQRNAVKVYDGSVYMEDLLSERQRERLVFLDGKKVSNPIEVPVYKAEWVLRQPWGVNTLKLKMGRQEWMDSWQAAVERDIAVTNAIHEAIGDKATIFVDGNNGYSERPDTVMDYVDGTARANLHAMEEMIGPTLEMRDAYLRIKNHIHERGLDVKLTDGEVHGIPREMIRQRAPYGDEPLFNIDNADMNIRGFFWLMNHARFCRQHGLRIAPHNFGSEIGVYKQVHLGLVVPNFEFAEGDDARYSQYLATGIRIEDGIARLTDDCVGLGVSHDPSQLPKPVLAMKR